MINPCFPWACAFMARWGERNCKKKRLITKEQRNLKVFIYHLYYVRAMSTLSFISFTIFGPHITATRGLVYALIVVVIMNLIMILTLVPILWTHRYAYRLKIGKVAALCLENMICFPYTAALVKRLSLNYEIRCDGLLLAKTLQPNSNFLVILENAAGRMMEQVEELSEPLSGKKDNQEYIDSVRAF